MNQINVGLTANDGLGDKLRDAFIIVNENFTYIQDILSGTGSFTIIQVQGLQTALDNINNQLVYIPSLQSDINDINSTIYTINQTLNSQNISISDLYNEISNLQTQIYTKIGEAPINGLTYGRKDGAWAVVSGGATAHSGLYLDDGTNPHNTTKADVGLGNVDNTSDINKPISTATQNALNSKKSKRYEIEYEDNFYSNSSSAGSTFAPVIISGIVNQQIFTSGIFTPPSFDSTTGNLLQLSTGTNAAGLASITLGSQNNPGSFFPGQGEFMMETKVTFPALSTASESFMYMFGLHSSGNVLNNNLISFKYDPERICAFGAGPATGNLVTCTTNLNNRTFTDTGIVVNVNQWYWLKIIVNSTGTQVRFFINNVLVATHTTDIELNGKHLTNLIRKNAGTAPRLVQLRYMYFGHTPNNPIHL